MERREQTERDVFNGTYVDVRKGEGPDALLSARGGWVGAHLSTTIAWPTVPHSVVFEGHELIVRPAGDDYLPAVFIRDPRMPDSTAKRVLSRFISAWSWLDQDKAIVESWSSGSHPTRRGVIRGRTINEYIKFDFLPQGLANEVHLALAFFREGMSLDHPAYQFLSFYKIVNLARRKQPTQMKLIRKYLPMIVDGKAKERVSALQASLSGQSIEDYLWQSCRCAVAHASLSDPTIDPEDPDDERRLRDDLPLIKALASLIIRSEFGVPTKTDVWNSKEYMLEGFRWHLGQAVADRLDAEEAVGRRSVDLPKLANIRVWGRAQLTEFRAMHVRVVSAQNGLVVLEIMSDGGSITMSVQLDFPANRLKFEPLTDIRARDLGTPQSAVAVAEYYEFMRDMVGNGCLEIWTTDDQVRLGQSDEYIPLNLIPVPDESNRQVAMWRELADRRATESVSE